MGKVPIIFIIYNRPTETEKSFSIIRDYKPEKLFIVADWAKNPTNENVVKCQKTREVTDNIDWDCDVIRDYSEVNLGCKDRIYSGITNAFENVSEAIILEDDCLPSKSFFQFCEEMLLKYKDESEVSHISGTNFLELDSKFPYSYTYSRHFHCWGWATWKSSWMNFDFEMNGWPIKKEEKYLKNYFSSSFVSRYWTKVFDKVYLGEIDSWAYRWTLSSWINKKLAIIPRNNLVTNIGFNDSGTHTDKGSKDKLSIKSTQLDFPLSHPNKIIQNIKYDQSVEREFFSGFYLNWLKSRIKLILNKK